MGEKTPKHDLCTCGTKPVSRALHLARSGSQSQREIRFILSAHGARQIINDNIATAIFQRRNDQEIV